jgi:threonine/homoserine/homoserine lactone efflux protein
MEAAIVGFGLGFAVALQLGPMSLFLIRSTLRAGWRVGLAAGTGIAVVDALYATCGVAGAAPQTARHRCTAQGELCCSSRACARGASAG